MLQQKSIWTSLSAGSEAPNKVLAALCAAEAHQTKLQAGKAERLWCALIFVIFEDDGLMPDGAMFIDYGEQSFL